MALNGLFCADVPLSNYSTHSHQKPYETDIESECTLHKCHKDYFPR